MVTEFKLPDLGEGIDSATVVDVLVGVGDTITVDQPVLVLETDKAEFEVPSSVAGKVVEVLTAPQDEVTVNQVLLKVETDGEVPAAEGEKKAAEQPAEEEAPEQAPAPAPEETVEAEPEPEVESAPAPVAEAEREAAEAAPAPVPPEPREGKAEVEAKEPPVTPVPASPAVRRLARELGVDVAHVRGTGEHGRIQADDVRAYAKQVVESAQAGVAAPGAAPAKLPDFERYGAVRREPMSKVRRATAEQMARAWAGIPHVTQHDRADVTELEGLRKTYAPRVDAAGGKLTVTAILIKILAHALHRFPKFNASLDLGRHEVVFKDYVHVGVAVDTEKGLLVPVIRDADTKNVTQIAVEMGDLAEKARARNIRPDQMQGGTFTITNLGGIGGTAFTPIINPPEVAILGVSRAHPELVLADGQPTERLMLPLSLSYDHRLIDGAEAARFLRWVCEAAEHPVLLALEG